MAYQIEYAYTCHNGKVRANNEDNFWCCGESLEVEHQGTEDVITASAVSLKMPALAVFDGMGGESCGEIASFLASKTFGEFYKKNKKEIRNWPDEFLEKCCESMNHAVCEYGRDHKIRSMGTTAAILVFGKEQIGICNLGDSRIYQFSHGQFRQISADHVLDIGLFGKAPLTQYVGVPEEQMDLEPMIDSLVCETGTRYLICSDGLTDMLSDGEIADVLSRDSSVQETVELLQERALKKGGRDNITIVLCEILEWNWQSGLEQWLKRFAFWKKGDKHEKPDA